MNIESKKIISRSTKNTLISIISSRKDLPLEFLKQGLKDGKNCVFVSTNIDTKVIENELKKTSISNDINNRIRFIDCSGRKCSFNVYRYDLRNLNHLNVVLTQSLADLMTSKPRICILDSLFDIEKNNKPEDFSKFIEIFRDIVKEYDAIALLFSNKESEGLKNHVDRVILIE